MRAHSIGIIFLLMTLVSCGKKDENSLGAFRIDIATVQLEGEGNFSLLLDNGKTLWPAAYDIRYNPKSNQRVFVNYTLLSGEYGGYDHLVKVNHMWNILTKDIVNLTVENSESIGNDSVRVNHIWLANDYLNIDFLFNYGGKQPHAINLVNVNSTLEPNQDDIIELEFRHNSFNSTSKNLIEGLVSFNLKPLKQVGVDSVNIAIKIREPQAERIDTITYKYSNFEIQNSYIETPILVIDSDEYY